MRMALIRRLAAGLAVPLAALPLAAVVIALAALASVVPARRAEAGLAPNCQASWFAYGYVMTQQQWLTCLNITAGGGVTGPVSSILLDLACFTSTVGASIGDCGPIPTSPLLGGLDNELVAVSVGSGLLYSSGTLSALPPACSSVTDAGCTNSVNTWMGTQSDHWQTLSIASTTFTPAAATGNDVSITLVHSACNPTACNIANWSGTLVPGTHGVFEVIQSSTGSDTVTWDTDYVTQGHMSSITLSTGAGDKDYFSYVVNPAGQTVVSSGDLNAVH